MEINVQLIYFLNISADEILQYLQKHYLCHACLPFATRLKSNLCFCSSFPADLLFTSSSGELWRMVRIGGQPLGFGEATCF